MKAIPNRNPSTREAEVEGAPQWEASLGYTMRLGKGLERWLGEKNAFHTTRGPDVDPQNQQKAGYSS